MLIMVLNDDETFSAVTGCAIYIVPDEADTDELEAALNEGALKPAFTFTDEAAARLAEDSSGADEELFTIRFCRGDIDGMAEEREIDPDLAWERALAWRKGIEEANVARINESLWDVIGVEESA